MLFLPLSFWPCYFISLSLLKTIHSFKLKNLPSIMNWVDEISGKIYSCCNSNILLAFTSLLALFFFFFGVLCFSSLWLISLYSPKRIKFKYLWNLNVLLLKICWFLDFCKGKMIAECWLKSALRYMIRNLSIFSTCSLLELPTPESCKRWLNFRCKT